MYPLKFRPLLFSKVWGGNKLKKFYPSYDLHNIGECWLVSAIEDNESKVENGFLAENSLSELLEVYLTDLVGESIYNNFGNNFPMLVKTIDAEKNLSVQVHPNDEVAIKRHNSFGKNEFWYMIDCEPNAFITAGFNRKLTEKQFIQAVENSTLEQYLKVIYVQKGDYIYIPAGCVHSIGKGCTLLEIQQSSDITYRIYDYDRADEQGNRRQLHIKQAVEVIDFEKWNYHISKAKFMPNSISNVHNNKSFIINIMEINKEKELLMGKIDSFVLLSVVEGSMICRYGAENVKVSIGETILVPACIPKIVLSPENSAKILESYVVL
jgi:mannose-6-phosphate isomerase